ncbi:MAG: TlpA family protein disulfide reductase [Bacteroidetes bacterium]|nr:TlpA family protein disulfide reductase [Bacteroidota bacterium]MBU1719038.1 TlpA family protein disulfide reductase [Bacteroidota bacterium]
MKKTIFLLFVLSVTFSSVIAQDDENKVRTLPAVDVKALDGSTFNTSNLENDGKPIILSFWATWCKPCVKELTSIHEVYADWQTETGVKLVAVSIDNSRSTASVAPLVNSNLWDYLVLLDPNNDLKRAMGVNMIPHTFILNGKGEIVWEHTSFSEGGELELIDIVRKIINGEDISDE